MANTDLEKCPEQLQKTTKTLLHLNEQIKIAEIQMELFKSAIEQNFEVDIVHDSIIIKGIKNGYHQI